MAAHIAGGDAGGIGEEGRQLDQPLPRLRQLAVKRAAQQLQAGTHVVQAEGHLRK